MRKNSHLLINLLIPIIILLLAITFISLFKIIIVDGQSMEPTLRSGKFTLAQKSNSSINVNDIIIFQSKDYGVCVKRVVACENDEIQISNGKLYINGAERANYSCSNATETTIKLSKDEYYVLGDNANASIDSRTLGIITQDIIIGKLILY